jgi:adenosylcobyric acid synthase
VNKFRGDISLFHNGVRILEERGGVPVLGVVPWLRDLAIPEEDAVALDASTRMDNECGDAVDIAVVHLPHIANFDDFDPLNHEPGVRLRYVSSVAELGDPDAIVLPGTKSTVADLDWLRKVGLASAVEKRASQGTRVVGICGGYQMLGHVIRDPQHVESQQEIAVGLGLLPVETAFEGEKEMHRATARVEGGPGWLATVAGQMVTGYEIHMGRTQGSAPWLTLTERSSQPAVVADGSVSDDGEIWGCYLHGLFANVAFRRAWLGSMGWYAPEDAGTGGTELMLELDRLACEVEAAINMDLLERIVWGS